MERLLINRKGQFVKKLAKPIVGMLAMMVLAFCYHLSQKRQSKKPLISQSLITIDEIVKQLEPLELGEAIEFPINQLMEGIPRMDLALAQEIGKYLSTPVRVRYIGEKLQIMKKKPKAAEPK